MGEQSNFVDWLYAELEKRDMNQADLARRAQLSSGTLSNITSGDRRPGERVCRAIAQAFGIPAEEVYRAAGLLPPVMPRTERIGRILAVVQDLPEDEQDFLEEWARLRLERWRKAGGGKRIPNGHQSEHQET